MRKKKVIQTTINYAKAEDDRVELDAEGVLYVVDNDIPIKLTQGEVILMDLLKKSMRVSVFALKSLKETRQVLDRLYPDVYFATSTHVSFNGINFNPVRLTRQRSEDVLLRITQNSAITILWESDPAKTLERLYKYHTNNLIKYEEYVKEQERTQWTNDEVRKIQK